MSGMFTGGQLSGALLGAAIGALFPPAGFALSASVKLGITVGMFIGGIIDPPDQMVVRQEGPRLGDASIQTSEWGLPIARVYGTYRLAGNIIWGLPLHETKHVEETGEGKGGGGGTKTETTWYSYSGSWAIAFCEGEISGITRIWFDSVLVFDGSNYSGGLNSGNHTIYNGSSTQQIDWYIQSNKPDTPAYRNVCYIVFRKIELENYGNRLPKVTVEVSKKTKYLNSIEKVTSYMHEFNETLKLTNYTDQPSMSPAIGWNNNYGYYLYNIYEHHQSGSINAGKHTLAIFDGSGNIVKAREYYDGFSNTNTTETIFTQTSDIIMGHGNNNTYYKATVFDINLKVKKTYSINSSGDIRWFAPNYASFYDGELFIAARDKYAAPNDVAYSFNYIFKADNVNSNSDNPEYYKIIDKSQLVDCDPTKFIAYDGMLYFISSEQKNMIRIFDFNGAFVKDIHFDNITKYNTNEYFIKDTTKHIIRDNVLYIWTRAIYNGVYEYQFLEYDLFIFSIKKEMKVYSSTDAPIQDSGGCNISGNEIGYIDLIRGYFKLNFSIISENVTIGSIVKDQLLYSGLNESDFDISAGTDLVHGYVISDLMPTRDAISSLISAYEYELIESNFKLILKKRYPDPVVNIPEENVITVEKIVRYQTVELSKQINIIYANKDKNYDAGTQSIQRIDPDVENVKSYQFSLALSDDEAKKIAERYLYSEWNERIKFDFMLPTQYIYLLPSQVITLNWKGISFNIRISKISLDISGSVIYEGFREDIDILNTISTGSNTSDTYIQTEVEVSGPTNLELLDIPMLDNAYNKEGIYLAANGYTNGWKGCTIDKSTDAGATYSFLNQIVGGTLIGYTTTKLNSGTTTSYDLVNSVTVFLNGELSSFTWESILSGKNYCLIGNEILQFKDAIDNLNGTYTLSGLLRGRRGTEWAISTHSTNERFVFFDTNMIFDSTASLNVDTYYKATTFGDFIEDSSSYFIRPEIKCLKPLAPSMISGTRDLSNNLTITWKKRSRDVTGYFKTLSLFEDSELYEIDILDSNDNVIATKSGITSEVYYYSDSEQKLDNPFHNSGDKINVIIYQISGIVQRGYGEKGYV